MGLKVAIINDTTGPHFGCQLVMESYRSQLERVDATLLGTVSRAIKSLDDYPSYLHQADLVIVNGEGSIHHGKRGELIELANRYPAILINCVYQDNPRRAALGNFRFVSARESLSVKALQDHGVPAQLIPDVILTSPTLNNFRRHIRSAQVGLTDGVLEPDVGISAKIGLGGVGEYLEEISRYAALCTGRFHTALAAAVLRIPFSVWASNSHKNAGLLNDMGILHFYAECRRDAMQRVPGTFDEKINDYVRWGQLRIAGLFESLEEFV